MAHFNSLLIPIYNWISFKSMWSAIRSVLGRASDESFFKLFHSISQYLLVVKHQMIPLIVTWGFRLLTTRILEFSMTFASGRSAKKYQRVNVFWFFIHTHLISSIILWWTHYWPEALTFHLGVWHSSILSQCKLTHRIVKPTSVA